MREKSNRKSGQKVLDLDAFRSSEDRARISRRQSAVNRQPRTRAGLRQRSFLYAQVDNDGNVKFEIERAFALDSKVLVLACLMMGMQLVESAIERGL